MKKSPGPPLVMGPGFLRARLDQLHMTQSNFALRMGTSKKQVSEIVNGIAGIPWWFALGCEYVLKIGARELMDLQGAEELYRARVRFNERPRPRARIVKSREGDEK